jgi:branched-chain amino acid aminotransferase
MAKKLALRITRATQPGPRVADPDLGFGRVFTDHMLVMDYAPGTGWHDARIEPYGPLTLDPACLVLHYGQAVFDGFKAFRSSEGGVVLFRPTDHIARLNASSARLCIPPVDEAFVLDALKQLIRLDAEWVPRTFGCSLYIRPVVIATEAGLGVRPSKTYRFYTILSPVGAYYKEGFQPVRILVSDKYVRAVQGGLGAAKTPANYAASLLAAEEAKAAGFTQVLWLDGRQRTYVEEVGTMNIFFRVGNRLVTPPLEGTILAGITRDCVIRLAAHWGIQMEERRISMPEVLAAHEAGQLLEIFGSGTAAVISPVSELVFQGRSLIINQGRIGDWTQRLFETLTGIQYGKMEDPFGWTVPVSP